MTIEENMADSVTNDRKWGTHVIISTTADNNIQWAPRYLLLLTLVVIVKIESMENAKPVATRRGITR